MRKFNITVNGKNYSVEVEEEGGAIGNIVPVAAPAATAAPKVAPAPAVTSGSGSPMTSPMPGLVKALKVKNGTAVKKGQVVLVLEAMKMENDIASHADGVITFATQEGANVDSGAVLFTIA